MDANSKTKKSRRGPVALPENEKRSHTVSVRLNESELAWLDEQRSKIRMRRGEYLRFAATGKLPPVVPEINREAWVLLSRSAANLNQIARHFNAGDDPAYHDIVNCLREFRCALIDAGGAKNES